MTISPLLAAAAISFGVASAANAASVTLDFPSSSSTQDTATGGTFFFTAGDFSEGDFTDTGIDDLTTLDLAINLATNVLAAGAFVNFDVFVNSAVVGDFTISDGDGLGQFDFLFAVLDENPLEDDYTLRFEATNTVPGGLGSVSFDFATSSATISDGAVAVVPLPASIPLLLAGLGALGIVGRKRKAA